MASRASNRLLPKILLVSLSMVCAFGAVTWYMSVPHESIRIAVPVAETKPQKSKRLGREQSVKDWGAAQRRADARNAAAEVH